MARILVIEDLDLVSATIKRVLEGAGHGIAVAADGLDGLRQFQRSDFALVICDVFMARKDGLATLKKLRETRGDVPVIVTSGGSMRPLRAGEPRNPDYLQMATELGAAQTIAKPFNTRELTTLVAQVLAKASPLPLH
ncbi:MAG TPA: response regulator [Candidatus Angelobacter sp.]|nr:response regulator [Candidatus Angelobacter sp.]